MFRIKICGVTKLEDAHAAAEAGADAVGLNFYSKSPRFIELDAASILVASLPPSVAKVGVFVNATVAEMEGVASHLKLDYLQLHGDEPPELLAKLSPRPVIRAFRFGERAWQPIVEYLAACRAASCEPAALLIDAHAAGWFGGTGKTADWELVRKRPDELGELPIILAGGLTPENVSKAISIALPGGVDTASGVETEPGIKDHAKLRAFVSQARAALEKLDARL